MAISQTNGTSDKQSTALSGDQFYNAIHASYSDLTSYTSWDPTDDLLKLYSDTISLCLTEVSPSVEEEIFKDPRIQKLLPKLREVWGEARGAFEDFWSKKITSAESRDLATTLLNQYPSLKNYHSTCPLEMGLVTTVLGRTPKKMAMIGCGPLPLTGMSYVDFAQSQGHDLEVLNIDIVPERLNAAKIFCNRIGCTDGMEFLLADGRSQIKELAQCDVVLLASVAGITDQDKAQMTEAIAQAMSPGSLILTRGSNGLGRMLYPRLDLQLVEKVAPSVQPALMAVALDGPTRHGIYVLRKTQN